MNAKDRLLTEEEAKNIILKGWCSPETTAKDICLEPWIEEITEAQDAKTLRALRPIVEAADQVMKVLEEYGPSIVPHLLDTDDNDGERLRRLLAELDAQGKGKEG